MAEENPTDEKQPSRTLANGILLIVGIVVIGSLLASLIGGVTFMLTRI